MDQQLVKKLRIAAAGAAVLAFGVLNLADSQETPRGGWFKGNLHTHTINSDGDSSPDTVARWYKEHRYHFLALTDHDYLTDPASLNQVLGAEERFLLIPGEEVTAGYRDKPIHLNAFRISATIPPVFSDSVVDTIQRNVAAILQAGGIPSLNHPNFGWAITPEELAQVRQLSHFEVYNGHPTVNNDGGGGSPSLDAMWDAVLSSGVQIFGIATDDAHVFKQFGPEYSNPGRGWVMVRARALTTESILDALERGDFYASTGVELEDVRRGSGKLEIAIKPAAGAKYTTRFIGPGGEVLETSHELTSSYRLPPGQEYVRAKVYDSNGNVAWVQPVWAE